MTHDPAEAVADTAALLARTIHEALAAATLACTSNSRWVHTGHPVDSPEEVALRDLARRADEHDTRARQLLWDTFYAVTGGRPFGAKSRQPKVVSESPLPGRHR